jgi:hypothetical protein
MPIRSVGKVNLADLIPGHIQDLKGAILGNGTQDTHASFGLDTRDAEGRSEP